MASTSRRKSKTETALTVAGLIEPQTLVDPDPPKSLTAAELVIWKRTLQYAGTHLGPDQTELLAQYCRHAVIAESMAGMIRQALTKPPPPNDPSFPEYVTMLDKLTKVDARNTGVLQSLAVRLRISQSAFRDDKKKNAVSNDPPPFAPLE